MGNCCKRQLYNLLASCNNLGEDIRQDDFFQYASLIMKDQVFVIFNSQGISTSELVIVENDQKYNKYVKVLNDSLRSNNSSATRILSNLFYRYKQQKNNSSQLDIRNTSTNQILPGKQREISLDIIKYFIFFYTADQIYAKMFKQDVRKQKYSQIADLVNLIRPHISQHMSQDQKRRIFNQSENKIFKGFPEPADPTLIKLSKTSLNKSAYFGSFFLVQLRENRARTRNGWVTINLDQKIQHQFLIVKPPFTEPGTLKVIVFPFFFYRLQQQKKTANVLNVILKQAKPNNTS